MSQSNQSKVDGRDEPSKSLSSVTKAMGTQEVALPSRLSKAIMEKSNHRMALLEGVTEKLGELVDDGLTHKADVDGHAIWFGDRHDLDSLCVSGSRQFLKDFHGDGVRNPEPCQQTCATEGPPTPIQACMTCARDMDEIPATPHLRVARPGDRRETERQHTFGTAARGRRPCGQTQENGLTQRNCDTQDTSGIPERGQTQEGQIPESKERQETSGTPESVTDATMGNTHQGASLIRDTSEHTSEDQKSELKSSKVNRPMTKTHSHSQQRDEREPVIQTTSCDGKDPSGHQPGLEDGPGDVGEPARIPLNASAKVSSDKSERREIQILSGRSGWTSQRMRRKQHILSKFPLKNI